MKTTILVLVLIFTLLVGMGKLISSNHYSPLDTYINTSVKSAELNHKSATLAKQFIDSLNKAGIKNYKNFK